MNNYQVGDWGMAHFKYHCKGLERGITAYGQILAVEKKVVLFRDDVIEYLINRKDFEFEKNDKSHSIEKK
jgi:hypothetical protein